MKNRLAIGFYLEQIRIEEQTVLQHGVRVTILQHGVQVTMQGVVRHGRNIIYESYTFTAGRMLCSWTISITKTMYHGVVALSRGPDGCYGDREIDVVGIIVDRDPSVVFWNTITLRSAPFCCLG